MMNTHGGSQDRTGMDSGYFTRLCRRAGYMAAVAIPEFLLKRKLCYLIGCGAVLLFEFVI